MSANTNEGNVSQTADTGAAAGVASPPNSSEPAVPQVAQSYGDIWSQIATSDPIPQPLLEAVTDDDVVEAAPVEAAPETPQSDSTVTQEDGEDPFEKIDPTNAKAGDFKAIRASRKEVVQKLKEYEPIVQSLEQIGGKQVLDFVAPIFKTHADPVEGIKEIIGAVKNIHSADPSAGRLFDEAAYAANPQKYQAWALEDSGITKEDYQAFQEWKTGGKPTATDVPPPQPDEDGIVTLPDGTQLDVTDPRDRLTYDLLVKDFNYQLAERNRTAEEARQKEAADAKAQADAKAATESQAKAAVESFVKETDAEVDAAINSLKFDAGSEQETALAKVLVLAMSEIATRQNPDFHAAMDEGRRLAIEGGSLAQAKGQAATRIVKANLLQAHTKVMGLFNELHALRQQVSGNAPKIPQLAQPQTNPAALPPPQPLSPANPYAQIWDSAFGGGS